MLICKDNNEHFVLTELMSLAPEKIAFTFSERASKNELLFGGCFFLGLPRLSAASRQLFVLGKEV